VKKTRSKVIKIVLLVLAIGLVSVVVFYLLNPRKALKLAFPDVHKINYINAFIKNDSAYTKISVALQNKNPYKLSIDTLAFEVKLNDTSIAVQSIPLNISQARFDEDTVKLPLNLSIKKIQKLIANLQSQDSTTIKIIGYVVYETIFGRTRIHFNKENRIQVPIPPKIKVLKVERKNFSYKDKLLKANATIEIINNGKNIDIQLTNIHYNMVVKNTLQSHGVISKPLTIKPHSSIIFDLPIEIEIYHPLKTALMIGLDNDRLNYSLEIKCNIKENVSESSFSSPAEVRATGVLELVK